MTVDLLLGIDTGVASPALDERVVAQAALDAAEEALQSLCASHAGTFVSVERRGRAMEAALQDLLNRIGTAQTLAATAQEALERQQQQQQDEHIHSEEGKEDTTSLAVLSERHRVRRRTLLQHSALLELLELPSLMDAAVRSALYEEALSIAAFANTLERRHGSSSGTVGASFATTAAAAAPRNKQDAAAVSTTTSGSSSSAPAQYTVVGRVILQIRSRQADLRRHLLHRLKGGVTMPQCLEVVTALRRLNSIDLERSTNTTNTGPSSETSGNNSSLEQAHASMELRLQVDFLEARDVWLDSIGLGTGGSHHGPSFATQRSASYLTSSNTNLASSTTSSEQLLDVIERYRTRVFEVATQFNAIFRAQTTVSESTVSLLSMWTARRVHSFLRLLERELSTTDDAAALRDAVEASTFFATSLGRLGADFTAQIAPIVEPRMLSIVRQYWKEGAAQLTETLRVCREAAVATPLMNPTAVATATAETEASGETGMTGTGDAISSDAGAPQPPPRQLMAMPPLARFVNSILTGLNELRRCLLPGIFSSLRTALEETLATVAADLEGHERAVQAPGFRGQATELRAAAAQYKTVWKRTIEPYLRGSLESALGHVDAAAHWYQTWHDQERPPAPAPAAESNEANNASEETETADEPGDGTSDPAEHTTEANDNAPTADETEATGSGT